jgi:hypothetical protein
MSLEQQISELRDAIVHLTAAIKAQPVASVTSAPAPSPVIAAPPVVAVAGPYPPTPAVPAPVMPPPPSFTTAPAPAPTGPVAPFSDGKGLIAYVMAAYTSMGPAKGAGIQGVLSSMGLTNVNDVQPAQYGDFYSKVEALK